MIETLPHSYPSLTFEESQNRNNPLSFGVKATTSFARFEQLIFPIFHTLQILFEDPPTAASVFRKIEKQVIPLIEQIQNSPYRYEKLKSVLGSVLGIIHSIQIAVGIDYFAKAKFKCDPPLKVSGNAMMFIAHVGEGFLWLKSIGLIHLKNISNTLSLIPVFNMVTKIKLNSIVNQSLTLSYAFFAMHSLSIIANPATDAKKTLAKYELAQNSAELTLNLMLMCGVTNIPSLGIMGLICIGLGVSSLYHSRSQTWTLDRSK